MTNLQLAVIALGRDGALTATQADARASRRAAALRKRWAEHDVRQQERLQAQLALAAATLGARK